MGEWPLLQTRTLNLSKILTWTLSFYHPFTWECSGVADWTKFGWGRRTEIFLGGRESDPAVKYPNQCLLKDAQCKYLSICEWCLTGVLIYTVCPDRGCSLGLSKGCRKAVHFAQQILMFATCVKLAQISHPSIRASSSASAVGATTNCFFATDFHISILLVPINRQAHRS